MHLLNVCIRFFFIVSCSAVVDHHSPHLNEFVAPPQEQNIHHQHQHQQMVEPEKVNEIPIQTEIKQVIIYVTFFSFSSLKGKIQNINDAL